jgi:hypothetical protein
MGRTNNTTRYGMSQEPTPLMTLPGRIGNSSPHSRPWLDRGSSFDARETSLLREMTLAEKIGQLWQSNGIGSG